MTKQDLIFAIQYLATQLRMDEPSGLRSMLKCELVALRDELVALRDKPVQAFQPARGWIDREQLIAARWQFRSYADVPFGYKAAFKRLFTAKQGREATNQDLAAWFVPTNVAAHCAA